MNRDAKISEFDLNFEKYIQKNESLIIQLCEHIFSAGFVFQDSTSNEIEAGEWVIRDFFDQHIEVFFELVPRNRLNSFFSYLNNFDLSMKQLKIKLHKRILKAFDILSKGNHHHFNIRQNIAKGLSKKDNHPLYDLLMYIETYYNLVLKLENEKIETHEKNTNLTTKHFNLEDLKKLRNNVQDRLIGRELVKRFLNNIAKERRIPYESLTNIKRSKNRPYPLINFVTPTNQYLKRRKNKNTKKQWKNFELKNTPDIVELSIKNVPDILKNKLLDKKSRSSFEKKISESDTIINGGKNEIPKFPKEFHQTEKNLDYKEKISLGENEYEIIREKFSNSDDVLFNNSLYSDSYDNDVVFGNKEITQESMGNFVMEYPDSALKFIFKKNLDGSPLMPEIEEIYIKWEKRGLLKNKLQKLILKIMQCKEFPDIPTSKILQILREKIYEISENKKNKS